MKSSSHNHICLISPSLKMGGIERALVVLANYFSDEGYIVTFISCLKGKAFYTLRKNINRIKPDFNHSGTMISSVTFYPRLAWFIRKEVNKLNPNVVLTFGDWFSPIVLMALYGTKYPVFISDRTSPDYKFKFPIPQLKKWLYPKSTGFIAQTIRAAEYKRKQFGDKLNIKVIPNAIRDVKLYPEIQRGKVILYVGRFAWEKGPERLIQAFSQIDDKAGWQLHMAGSGPLLEPMKKLAKELGYIDSIVFLGQVEDVDSLFARSSIYVLPSVLEGFPNALCEAMAAGLPAICFDSIPHEAILTNQVDGLVVKDGDLDGLRNTLMTLMHNQILRNELGCNARKISERLSIDQIGQQVIEFIN